MEKVLILKNLNCMNCANKIEAKCKKLDGIKDANFNFVNKKMTLKLEGDADYNNILNTIISIVKDSEPDVDVIPFDDDYDEDNSLASNFESCCCCGHDHNHEHKHNHDHKEHNHNNEHAHSHNHGGEENKNKTIFRLGISFVLLIIGLISKNNIFYLLSYIFAGFRVIKNAFRNIFKGEIFDENFLMTIATFGAIAIKSYSEAVGVMLFFEIGEFLQDLAVDNSKKSITNLVNLKDVKANLIKDNGEIIVVKPDTLKINDLIVVKPGEKVPVDGIIYEGTSFIDTSSLTGESVPKKYEPGDEILSGTVNKESLIKIKVTKTYKNSAAAKIINLIEEAASKKSNTEKFITRFARYYTPIVVISSVLVAILPPLLFKANFSTWFYNALVFLVVSCPCALVVSVPLSYFAGIGKASKNGILIKGSQSLENLNKVKTIVFDKTGTLTEGSFEVTDIIPIKKFSKDDVLKYASIAESYSNHPIGKSIIKKYNKDLPSSVNISYKDYSGFGIEYKDNKNTILAGNKKLMDMFNIKYEELNSPFTTVYVALNNEYIGAIIISDKIKEDSILGIRELKKSGITNTVMLTGDIKKVANNISEKLLIDKFYSDLLPEDKVKKLEEIINNANNKVAFIGDGINDAPSLMTADVGIAMGKGGSDLAIESADIVLMTDEISKVAKGLSIAKKTNTIVYQNIIFSLSIKCIVLLLSILNVSSLWFAVFADVGVTLLAILNSLRILRG